MVPGGIARCASSPVRIVFQNAASSAVWILGVEDDGSAGVPQGLVVVDHVEHGVDDRRREAGAAFVAHVPVVEVEATGPENPRGEVQLPPPVLEIGRPKTAAPRRSSRRPPVRRPAGTAGAGNRELQVPLVVERHRRHLAERVLAVEHPAVGARQQRVGDVADALLHRGARLRRRPGALESLPLQIGKIFAAGEPPGAGIRDREAGAGEPAVGWKELDPLLALLPGAPPFSRGPLSSTRRSSSGRSAINAATDSGVSTSL